MRGTKETALFTSAMLLKLNTPKNLKKRHWIYLSRARLLYLLIIEVFELAAAVLALSWAEEKFDRYRDTKTYQALLRARRNVLGESSDVGNFAMFTADNCHALEVCYATDEFIRGEAGCGPCSDTSPGRSEGSTEEAGSGVVRGHGRAPRDGSEAAA